MLKSYELLPNFPKASDAVLSTEIKRKQYLKYVGSLDLISQCERLTDNDYTKNRVDYSSQYYTCFPLPEFSERLYDIARRLKPGECCNLFFHSENHTMAITIRCTKDHVIIKIYDPNSTLMYYSILIDIDRTHNIKKISLRQLFNQKQLNAYFPKFQTAAFASLVKKPKQQTTPLNGHVDTFTTFSTAIQGLVQNKLLDSDDVVNLFASCNPNDGTPGVSMALFNI